MDDVLLMTEAERLAALHGLDLLDTAPEQAYDDLVNLAAALCRTPIAALNLVDADRQWSKACVGIGAGEAPRAVSFCACGITDPDRVMVIADAAADPAWAANP